LSTSVSIKLTLQAKQRWFDSPIPHKRFGAINGELA